MADGYTCQDCGTYHYNESYLVHFDNQSGGFCMTCHSGCLTPDSEQDMEHFLNKFPEQPGVAVMIAEGVEEASCTNEFTAAWQYLHDSGMAYHNLQGWFGRRCQDMISQGIIEP